MAPKQRPSIAAPSWQVMSDEPFIVELSDVMMRENGADWLRYCADTWEAASARALTIIEALIVKVDVEGEKKDATGLRL